MMTHALQPLCQRGEACKTPPTPESAPLCLRVLSTSYSLRYCARALRLTTQASAIPPNLHANLGSL